MDTVEISRRLCELTQQAIIACHNDDWQLTRSLIDQRDRQLSVVLSKDTSDLSEKSKYALREALEKLASLNTELSQLTISSRDQLKNRKSELERNVKAINSYLDNA